MRQVTPVIVSGSRVTPAVGMLAHIADDDAVDWGAPPHTTLLALVLPGIVIYQPFTYHGIEKMILRRDAHGLGARLIDQGVQVERACTRVLWQHALRRYGLDNVPLCDDDDGDSE